MATSPEPSWRTALYVTAAVLGIILTITGIATNVFGLMDRAGTERPRASAPSIQADASPTSTPAPSESAAAPEQDSGANTAQALRSAERIATEWLAATAARDLDKLVSLSEPPFYLDQDSILLSKSAIRAQYQTLFANNAEGQELQIDRITPQTIGQLKATGWDPGSDRVMGRLTLTDDDVVVAAYSGDEGIALFFRRSGGEVELAGVWD